MYGQAGTHHQKMLQLGDYVFSVHCLLTSPRPLYVEAIHAKSHTAGQGIHRMMMHNNSVI